MHLAIDTATSDSRAVDFTPSREGDRPVLADLLEQIPQDEAIGTVTADGGYDKNRIALPLCTVEPASRIASNCRTVF